MATKMIALVAAAFLISGFSWGRTESTDSQNSSGGTPASSSTSSNTYDSSSSYGQTQTPVQTQAPAAVSRKSRRSQGAETSSAAPSNPSTVTASAPAGAFPTSLISSLASGDEEERRARIESLRRLSQAMGKMGGPNAGAETAPVS